MTTGSFTTDRTQGEIKQRCDLDGQLFDTWEEAWQHMVDEHGWDREKWEEYKEVTALVDSVARHAADNG